MIAATRTLIAALETPVRPQESVVTPTAADPTAAMAPPTRRCSNTMTLWITVEMIAAMADTRVAKIMEAVTAIITIDEMTMAEVGMVIDAETTMIAAMAPAAAEATAATGTADAVAATITETEVGAMVAQATTIKVVRTIGIGAMVVSRIVVPEETTTVSSSNSRTISSIVTKLILSPTIDCTTRMTPISSVGPSIKRKHLSISRSIFSRVAHVTAPSRIAKTLTREKRRQK